MTKTIARFETNTDRFNPPLDQKQLFMTNSLLTELGLEDGQIVTLRFGTKHKKLQIVLQTFEQDNSDRIFRLTKKNTTFFKLRNGSRYFIELIQQANLVRIISRATGK